MEASRQSGSAPLLRACGLTKVFPGKVANRDVSMDVFSGEVHALLGENGAGKSTLVNMLSGLMSCDSGEVIWKGYSPVVSGGAKSASPHIGMVHQHFSLVPAFTLVENLMLLEKPSLLRPLLRPVQVRKRLKRLAEEFGVEIEADVPMGGLSVGEQQLGELLKALYFDCELLILDEPTAVLTPAEIERLWKIVRCFTARGRAVVLIAHKISEVLEIADRITVLRDGEVVASMSAVEAGEAQLATLMVGRQIGDVRVGKGPTEDIPVVLELKNVNARPVEGHVALHDLNLCVRAGEIVGVAGVDGNGQGELFHLIARGRRPDSGSVTVCRSCGGTPKIGRIPDDRRRYGVVSPMSVEANLMLDEGIRAPYAKCGFRKLGLWRSRALALIRDFDVRCAGAWAASGSLSGGNQQKVILAREMSGSPDLLVVSNPTRGLDIGAIEMIHRRVLAAAAGGCAVLLISGDLEEVLTMCHRVAVMHGGRIVGEQKGPDYNVSGIGLWMAGKGAAA